MASYASGRVMEILLIEDSLVQAKVTMAALKRSQLMHRLTLVCDGVEAMEFLNQSGRFARAPRPDLVLLDLGLPKKDGREVLREMKQDFDLREIPVVIITASQDEDDQLRSRLLGVEGYMTKPIDTDAFVSMVKRLKHLWRDDLILPPL